MSKRQRFSLTGLKKPPTLPELAAPAVSGELERRLLKPGAGQGEAGRAAAEAPAPAKVLRAQTLRRARAAAPVPTKATTLRLPAELHRRLKLTSTIHGIEMTELVVSALESYLKEFRLPREAVEQ